METVMFRTRVESPYPSSGGCDKRAEFAKVADKTGVDSKSAIGLRFEPFAGMQSFIPG